LSTLHEHRGSHFPWCCRVPLEISFGCQTRRPFSSIRQVRREGRLGDSMSRTLIACLESENRMFLCYVKISWLIPQLIPTVSASSWRVRRRSPWTSSRIS
jgi:hypothetical protein